MEGIFGRLDVDGDGSITEDDLPAMAEQGYHTRAQAALWETIRDFDLDGDNVVRTIPSDPVPLTPGSSCQRQRASGGSERPTAARANLKFTGLSQNLGQV
jgi:hypothetical protein